MTMHIHTMPTETTRVQVDAQDTGGSYSEQGVCIKVLLPEQVIDELLSNYDATSGTSPLVAYSRPIARAVLDALKAYVEEGG